MTRIRYEFKVLGRYVHWGTHRRWQFNRFDLIYTELGVVGRVGEVGGECVAFDVEQVPDFGLFLGVALALVVNLIVHNDPKKGTRDEHVGFIRVVFDRCKRGFVLLDAVWDRFTKIEKLASEIRKRIVVYVTVKTRFAHSLTCRFAPLWDVVIDGLSSCCPVGQAAGHQLLGFKSDDEDHDRNARSQACRYNGEVVRPVFTFVAGATSSAAFLHAIRCNWG